MIRTAVVAVAFAMVLAGCTGSPEPGPASPSPSSSPVVTPDTPSPSPSATESPSPTPEVTEPAGIVATSDAATLTARIPDSWVACDGTAGLGAPNARDVLGAWGPTGGCGSADTLVEIESLESPDAGLTADGYYAQAFSSMEEDPTLAVAHETWVNEAGLAVLLVEVRSTDGRTADGASFIVFAGATVVVGKLASAGPLDDALVARFRAVADSVDVH